MEIDKKERIIPAEIPAGHRREEAKKLVTDQQDEAIEQMAGDDAAFDPSVLDLDNCDNEILQNYNTATNEFEVVDARPEYAYLWGRYEIKGRPDYSSHFEIMSRAQRLLGSRVPGYELVNGPRERFPECWHLRAADGTRRIGDCQLYRVRKEVARAIEVKQSMNAKAREMGVGAQVLAYAAKHSRYVHANLTDGNPIDYIRERARSHGGIPRETFDQQMIQTLAVHKIAEDARTGNLYGIPVERAVRKGK